MTPEQQRIAIARACGWTYKVEKYSNGEIACTNWVSPDGVGRMLPDYLNDLNAMHEAEKALNDKEKLAYTIRLGASIGRFTFDRIHATAAQRAEAFLQAIGKWTP